MVATITNPLRVGLRQERVIAPQCLVIFGASGDLTHRKLVPALFELFKQRRLPSEFALLGCARRPLAAAARCHSSAIRTAVSHVFLE